MNELEQTKQALADRTSEPEQVKRVANELSAQVERFRDDRDMGAKDYCDLLDRHDALAVQVGQLRAAIKYCTEYLEESKLNTIASWSKAHVELREALAVTPPQCLAEYDCEVARKAVIHGFNCAVALSMRSDIEPLGIDTYAERVANVYVKTIQEFAKQSNQQAKP